KYAAFATEADPAKPGPFSIPNFTPVEGISFDRLDERRKLLGSFDQIRRDVDSSGIMGAMDSFQQKAWDIVGGPDARAAFDLDAEPTSLRERYGFMPEYVAPTPDRCGVPAWSQRMLLARRLVEAGVRLVTVDLRWWDTHVNPKTAQDVLATMYRHLGIDATKSYEDHQGRPVPILPSGNPVDELFA
ncbi:MAG: DUF1501 domain-containing protein, partial [Verrucomicrobia bacterium]|nr:DUF1501 domain-containing protein [Verrucomicrobiota bacterium]